MIDFVYTGQEIIPKNVTHLYCCSNQFTSLPESNQLTELPVLPPTLKYLKCNNNQLTELPDELPPTLNNLYCFSNQLTSLPELPPTLQYLDVENNNLLFQKYQSYYLYKIRKKQAEELFDWFIK
jgi:Leucine-rich repeat (LRR) protein